MENIILEMTNIMLSRRRFSIGLLSSLLISGCSRTEINRMLDSLEASVPTSNDLKHLGGEQAEAIIATVGAKVSDTITKPLAGFSHEKRPPIPDAYKWDAPTRITSFPASIPKPFLYLPYASDFKLDDWTAYFDHSTPNYQKDGLMGCFGELMSLNYKTESGRTFPRAAVYKCNMGQNDFKSVDDIKRICKTNYPIIGYYSSILESGGPPTAADPNPGAYFYDGHDGHDFAPSSTNKIRAAAKGTVWFGNYNDALGKVAEIAHPEGYLTRYAHLDSTATDLKTGDSVEAGREIGIMGGSGYRNGKYIQKMWGTHLHFSVFRWSLERQNWQITDPFGWDPYVDTSNKSYESVHRRDPLIEFNREASFNLWVDQWPRQHPSAKGSFTSTRGRPSSSRYLGGHIDQ